MVALAALAMVAWWSMLAAERAALQATERAARNAAVGVAVALSGGDDVELAVLLAEQGTGVPLAVHGADGDLLAGSAEGSGLLRVPVPGTTMEVSAEVDGDAGLGIGRYSRFVAAGAFLVMAVAVWMLRFVARDRRAARQEVVRLGARWEETAAADDLTGLGNRVRLVEDADALIARGTRYGNTFGLAVFEVEGRPTDDQLVAVASTLSGKARGGDLCYRLGGARFVVLLPEQDETGATLAADRIRRLLTDQLDHPVLAGASSFSPWLPCTAADLLTRAELDLGAHTLVRGGEQAAVAPFAPSQG